MPYIHYAVITRCLEKMRGQSQNDYLLFVCMHRACGPVQPPLPAQYVLTDRIYAVFLFVFESRVLLKTNCEYLKDALFIFLRVEFC